MSRPLEAGIFAVMVLVLALVVLDLKDRSGLFLRRSVISYMYASYNCIIFLPKLITKIAIFYKLH